MRHKHTHIIAALAAFGGIAAFAQDETAVSAKTEAVALFKNGYAVVWQEIEVPKSGAYRWEDVPAVIHGTFFIESDMEVEVRATQRVVSVPVDAKNPPRLAPGQMVDVWVSTPTVNEKLSGRIVDTMPAAEQNSLLPALRSNPRMYYDYDYGNYRPFNTPIVLEGENTHYFIFSGIVSATTREPVKELSVRRPVMVFNASKKDGGGGKIRVVYLTKGATWAPSYRVDILDAKRLRIEQAAVVRNEGLPMTDTELSLVSGFPQIECDNVLSPITPSQTLATFFQQLSGDRRGNNSRYMSQMISNSSSWDDGISIFDTSALGAGEGPDIHYNSIGTRTLETGDTLSLTTGKSEAEYRRLLECDLTKQAAEFYAPNSGNRNNEKTKPDVFDVLKFQNPLPFPMTTAPATVMDHSRFLGQSQTTWVNPGQVASVKITKVMNVSATYFEKMVEAEARAVQIFRSSKFIKVDVTATIDVINRRNEQVTMHVNSAFLGTIEASDIAPAKQTISPKDYWPNELHDLFWEITVEPGETKTITLNGWRWFNF